MLFWPAKSDNNNITYENTYAAQAWYLRAMYLPDVIRYIIQFTVTGYEYDLLNRIYTYNRSYGNDN